VAVIASEAKQSPAILEIASSPFRLLAMTRVAVTEEWDRVPPLPDSILNKKSP
jgi:hypothetical protein